jgi:thymidylate synthase ThyX
MVAKGGYHSEDFDLAEQARLSPYVTNLEYPVFCLTGLPQVTAAALFARYSRSPKSLRRLLLDEFLDEQAPDEATAEAGVEAGVGRARELFAKVLAEFGDDSVAQLAGVHIACEQVSQPLAKAIEWGRLAAYLEQSTRYIPYTDKRDGEYRYHRDLRVMGSRHAASYVAAMDGLFDTYCELIPAMVLHLDKTVPAEEDAGARKRALRALALDLVRGLLPAGTVSNVGVFASPQALEQLVMRLRAHPLPEAQDYAERIAIELQRVVPEFMTRLDRPDRGGVWVDYLQETQVGLQAEADRLGCAAEPLLLAPELGRGASPADIEPWSGNQVSLTRFDPDGEERIMAAALFAYSDCSEAALLERVRQSTPAEMDRIFTAAVGDRRNRRHRPGRSFEHTEYSFEVVSDYGAFRDLQRHRILTMQWQRISPELGYAIPQQVTDAGLARGWRVATERAEAAYDKMLPDFPEQAQYLVTLAHRMRYSMRMNAREALHMIELRTSPQGHPSYRRLCQQMLLQIDQVAGHHRVAQAMRFAGQGDLHLPRYAAEVGRGSSASS